MYEPQTEAERIAKAELQAAALAIEQERVIFGFYDLRDWYLKRAAHTRFRAERRAEFAKAEMASRNAMEWSVYLSALRSPSREMVKAKAAEMAAQVFAGV